MSYVLAIDAGTTGVRALAVDPAGAVTGWRYREFTQHYPQAGWVEHDAAEIWDAIVAVIRELVADAGRPDAIGITNQRETAVAWSRSTSAPRHRAIVWQDRRTAARCDELRESGALGLVRDATGLVLDPYFTGTKYEWLLTPNGGAVEADDDLALGTIDSWLLWNLTAGAVHATEPSNASRTMLLDIRTGAWSRELCDLLHVPTRALPDVRPSCGRFGVVSAPELPELADVAISGIAGDQQAALFGQACFDVGMTKNTYGTGSFVLMNVGDACPSPVDGLLTTVAWQLAPDGPLTYAYEGAIFVTGAAIQWLRDGLGVIEAANETGPLAASVDDAGGVVLVPAFTGLGSPYWDPYARGALLGITRGTGRAHLARAAVEAMVFQTRDVVASMSAASGHPIRLLRADGGASVMDILLQLQADQLQVPVARPVVQETTALGAAYLAGLAEGVWSSLDELAAHWQLEREFTPAVDDATAEAARVLWARAVERSRGWATD